MTLIQTKEQFLRVCKGIREVVVVVVVAYDSHLRKLRGRMGQLHVNPRRSPIKKIIK